MRIALISDTFPPLRNSGAVQMRDLAREFVRQSHQVTVILPSNELNKPWEIDNIDGIRILRLSSPKIKNIGYVGRTISELVMPFSMLVNLHRSPLGKELWDGIVWYSPSIFHSLLVKVMKKKKPCRSYLIIRDIFPQWAVDVGLIVRGSFIHHFFNTIANYQYSVADVIGVQTPSNKCYFKDWQLKFGRKLEVLQNWLDTPNKLRCPIRVSETILAGRKIFVYAGNMGVAQGMGVLISLAERMQVRQDVGFLFVGRGQEMAKIKSSAQELGLTNVLFFDEIQPDEISDLYSQCSVGIVALDPRHKTHNIPGKFLTYMQNGLPVLANVNLGNDLAAMIRDERVGEVSENNQVEELQLLAEKILHQIDTDMNLSERCRLLFDREFSVKQAVKQIVTALSS